MSCVRFGVSTLRQFAIFDLFCVRSLTQNRGTALELSDFRGFIEIMCEQDPVVEVFAFRHKIPVAARYFGLISSIVIKAPTHRNSSAAASNIAWVSSLYSR